jgi:hypothetical protein
LTEQRTRNLVLHPEHYNMHYLTAYLGAVIGSLSRRGMVIHTVERTLNANALSCSITFDPPGQRVDISASAWVPGHISWDAQRGWCCHLYHIAQHRSKARCYMGEPLVPAPERVTGFLDGLTRVQTLETLDLARPPARWHHTAQELANELIRFTPTCTWIG